MFKRKRDLTKFTFFGDLAFNLTAYSKNLEHKENGCIQWTGGTHRQGYGMFNGVNMTTGKRIMTVVHRIAMMKHLNRKLQREECVIHTCQNALCCNHEHMVIGDYYKKNEIMIKNGRGYENQQRKPRVAKKQLNRKYKYTEDEIRFCRKSKVKTIAKYFSISELAAKTLKTRCLLMYKWLD